MFNNKERNSYTFNALHLLSLENESQLCRMLNVSLDSLSEVISNPLYETFEIPKKKGGKRTIEAPEEILKDLQRKLNFFLNAYYLKIKPEAVFGFVIHPHELGKICAIAENAKPHVGKMQVLNIDIKDFFPSIKAKQVKALFQSELFQFDEHLASLLALLTTHKGTLPIGAPTSPSIANFICYQLDNELEQFCNLNELSFSRYADDITFSSVTKIQSDTILDIVSIINKQGFSINEKKFRIQSANKKQTVTGLVVNHKVNVDRKFIRKLRAIMHDIRLNGMNNAAQHHFNLKQAPDEKLIGYFIHRLEGLINFVGQVRGKHDMIYARFKNEFDEIFTTAIKE
jgi:RNA-directed DNA polymerase